MVAPGLHKPCMTCRIILTAIQKLLHNNSAAVQVTLSAIPIVSEDKKSRRVAISFPWCCGAKDPAHHTCHLGANLTMEHLALPIDIDTFSSIPFENRALSFQVVDQNVVEG